MMKVQIYVDYINLYRYISIDHISLYIPNVVTAVPLVEMDWFTSISKLVPSNVCCSSRIYIRTYIEDIGN